MGFVTTDFAAYETRKWSSNAFTLERLRVKEKLQMIGREMQRRFGEQLAKATLHFSDEFPSMLNGKKVEAQWLYYCRAEQAANELTQFLEKTQLTSDKVFQLAPQEKHVALSLYIDHEAVHLGVVLHPGAWVDRHNFSARLRHSWHRESFIQMANKAPQMLTFGFADEQKPLHEISASALESLAEPLHQDERQFVVGARFSASEVMTKGAAFAEEIFSLVSLLVPIYLFIAWDKENDHIEVSNQIRKEKAEQKKQVSGFKNGDKVRIVSGLFSGRNGIIQAIDGKSQVKVKIGRLAITVSGTDLAPL